MIWIQMKILPVGNLLIQKFCTPSVTYLISFRSVVNIQKNLQRLDVEFGPAMHN